MDTVHDISDWVVVMGEGQIIAEGTPDQVMADQRVIDAYLGAHHDGAVKTVAGHDVSASERSSEAGDAVGFAAGDLPAPEPGEPA
jgi:branched-chain amino acid transport system ATP-binding protein